jgi:nitrogen regulatory protein PII
MKWVSVVIAPSHLDDVVDAFCAIGITRLTVTELEGDVERACHPFLREIGDGDEGRTLVPRLQVDAALQDDRLGQVLDTLRRSARTGAIGEVDVVVRTLERAMRIRTGETGDVAL